MKPKPRRNYTRLSKAVLSNIMAVYRQANVDEFWQGMDWYDNVKNQTWAISQLYPSYTPWQVAGVIAVLSPGLNWSLNVGQALTLIKAHADELPIPMVGVYGRRGAAKAWKILSDPRVDIPDVIGQSAKKTLAFYNNIIGHTDQVTIDRHAKCLAYAIYDQRSQCEVVGKSEYNWLAKHYQLVAYEVGIQPSELQAITWVTWRRLVNPPRREVTDLT